MKNAKKLFESLQKKNYQGIFLDLDDTVCNSEEAYRYAERVVWHEWKKEHEDDFKTFSLRYAQAKREVKHRTKGLASSHSRLLYFQRMVESSSKRTTIGKIRKYEQLYWRAFFKKLRLLPQVDIFLKMVYREGYVVCIVTNLTAEIQFRKIQKLNIARYISYIVSSEEAGAEKPDTRIFECAQEKVGLPKESIVLIGDSVVHDEKGAREFGIDCIVV